MIKWLPAHQSLGAAPAAASGEWFTSGCSSVRARWNGSTIETDAVLAPRPFPDAVKQWTSEISSSAAKHGVSAPLVAAFMATESGGNPSAATSCCYGLMGFLPRTASWVFNDFKPEAEWKKSLTPAELLSNPAQNVDLGAKLIRHLWDQYKGNVVKMAATYNAGSVKCGNPKGCPTAVPNQWNVVSDCASGKVVDYPGRIILYNNKAVELGVFGGSAGVARKSSLFLPIALVGAVGAVWYLSRGRKLSTNPRSRIQDLYLDERNLATEYQKDEDKRIALMMQADQVQAGNTELSKGLTKRQREAVAKLLLEEARNWP